MYRFKIYWFGFFFAVDLLKLYVTFLQEQRFEANVFDRIGGFDTNPRFVSTITFSGGFVWRGLLYGINVKRLHVCIYYIYNTHTYIKYILHQKKILFSRFA